MQLVRRACGTKRTAFITMSFACQTGTQPGSKFARWWGCCRSAPRQSWKNGSATRPPDCSRASTSAGGVCRSFANQSMRPDRVTSGLRSVLTRMLDENEFLSHYGIRSLSRYHAEHPYVFNAGGQEFRVSYLPAESDSGMFGGNSNWRGPIWMPVNALIIRALLHYFAYYGDNFKIECPTGSGNLMNLFEVAREIANRLTRIFLRDETGRRPVFGGAEKFQNDPHWRDNLLFYEYFHGDNGAGIGASHQTGWTGVVALLIEIFGKLDAENLLEAVRASAFGREIETA